MSGLFGLRELACELDPSPPQNTMNVTVTLEQRFDLAVDGSVWTPGQGNYQFLKRYLEVFDSVKVVARTQRVSQISSGWKRADGERVSFVQVPHYLGPWQYLRRILQIKRLLGTVARSSEAAILHAPSILAAELVATFIDEQHPYALEVVSDPWDVFSPGVIHHPLRAYFRARFSRDLKRQCKGSFATAYVTKEALQARYPSRPDAFWASYSDVELGDEAFVLNPRNGYAVGRPIRLIMVGSLAQLYKGPDVLLDAVGICIGQGLDLRLALAGDGKYRPYLEDMVTGLGLSERVRFAGELPPGKEVRAELDAADIFILPSRTEGLPRAMIEAMARALPCIGSKVGGIPELLLAEDMVPAGNAVALAQKIMEVARDPIRLAGMSRRNLAHSKQYHESLLRQSRIQFYEYVRAKTAEWFTSRQT